MVIVWGSKLMGKCDVVPGLFHVATKFGHLWYLPLIPMGSWIVTEQNGDSWRGVQTSLSFKSIGLAWARTILFIMGMGAALYTLIVAMEGKKGESWVGPAFFTALWWGLCIMLSNAPFVTRAGFSRACELAKQVGVTQEGVQVIEKIYGRSAGRGFEIKVAPAMAAARPAPRVASRPQPIEDGGAIPLEPVANSAAEPVAKQRASQSAPIGLT